MGVLVYGGHQEIEIDDRMLAHLQIVIGSKLRRREGFFVSWAGAAGADCGRVTIWVDPAITLVFRYNAVTPGGIDREWLETLMAASNSNHGLLMTEQSAPLAAETIGVT
ncbi:ATP-dependent DNA ligase [Leifsonia sp. 2TAF2]|uniref:DUF7882 family protein n=1 Tax=Leifsonia sp. 2TAF2 TaxID=3233009 RepID=UPI003F997434